MALRSVDFIHARGLSVCLFITWTAHILQYVQGTSHLCVAGLTSSWSASCWVLYPRSRFFWLCMCHPGIQNKRGRRTVQLPHFAGTIYHPGPPWICSFHLQNVPWVDFEETLYLPGVLLWDIPLFKCTCGT